MIRIAWPSLWRAAFCAVAVALSVASPPSFSQTGEAAITKRATDLREAPGESGRSLASLPAQSPLTRLGERQGPWVRVRTEAGATGWLHLFDVGPATGAGANMASGALRGITNLFSKGGPSTAVTVPTSTIGVRGLSAEDLAQAQPNPAAVTQMEALRQNENQARAFASAASLRPVAVEPLAAPARPLSGTSSPAGDPGNPQAQ
jgi:hypothetical protein